MTGTAEPQRSAVASVGRAMRELAEAGLVLLALPSLRRRGANVFVRPLPPG
jgi:hypothetical protein